MFWLQGSTFITLLAMNTLVILQKLEGELYLMILLMCNCLSIRNKDSNGFFSQLMHLVTSLFTLTLTEIFLIFTALQLCAMMSWVRYF